MLGPKLTNKLRSALVVLACAVIVCVTQDSPWEPVALAARTHSSVESQLLIIVTTPEGKPARADVGVFCERETRYPEVGRGATDPQGHALLGGLPRGSCWVLVESAPYGRAALRREVRGGVQHVRVQLERAESLQVSVHDEALVPIGKASVLVDVPGQLPYGALTDAQGRVVLTRLGAGPYRVRVYAEGFDVSEQLGASQEVSLTLRRLARLRVTVKDSKGGAAAGAEVLVGGSSLWPVRRATTNAAGEVNVLGLPEGAYELKAVRGSEVASAHVVTELARTADVAVELTLLQGRFVNVEVVEDAPVEERIEGAQVVVSQEGLSFFPLRGETEKNGRLRLGPIVEGGVSVAAFAEGFVATHALAVAFPFPDPVQVKLVRGATLVGRVVDSRGFAVAGASIEVIGNDVFGLPLSETPQSLDFERIHFAWAESGPRLLIPVGELGVMPGPVPPIPLRSAALADTGLSGPLTDAWVSRDDGGFRAFPVTPGRVFAVARHPDYVDGLSEAVTLVKGGRAEVVITLYAGGELSGTVKDARGFAVAGARVEAVAAKGTLRRSAWTGVDGGFVFSALPQAVVLTVARPEAPFQPVLRQELTVLPERKQEIELELAELRGKVLFRVQGERAEPLTLVQISVASLVSSSPFRKTLFTDEQGRAELDDASGRALQYLVSAPGYAQVRHFEAELSLEVLVKLVRAVRVEGIVRGVRGRALVARATVTAQVDGVRLATTTDDSGNFALDSVPPKEVTFEVRHPEYALFSARVQVPNADARGRALQLGPWELEASGRISGVVVDRSHRPVSGARVAAGEVPEFLPVGALPPEVVLTNSEGRFELLGVREGSVEVGALLAGVGRGKSTKLQVNAGKITQAGELVLDQAYEAGVILGASLAVTLVDGEGGAGPRVQIASVARGSEAERAGLRSGDVLARVDGHVVASASEARHALEGPEGSDLSLELVRGSELLRLNALRERIRR